MRSQPALRLFEIAASMRRALLGAAATALLISCGGGGDNSPSAPSNGPIVGAPLDATACASADLSALTSMVYVSALGADSDVCGASSKNACATIAKGIAACADSGCAVLVRHGLYQTRATLDLRDGVNVHGSCRFDGEPNRRYRSTILAHPAAGTPAVRAASINQPTVFSGFVVIGKDETASSTASIAMAVKSSQGLTLMGTTIVAGRAGDAAPGASTLTPGGLGGDGAMGAPQLGADGGTPGASCRSNPPADSRGFGGAGASPARGGNPFLNECKQESGGPFGGKDSGDVAGGAAGGNGALGLFCTGIGPGDGGDGGNGRPGACGRPAQLSPLTAGSLVSDRSGLVWAPSAGEDGQDGSVGSGGGGGGGGGYCALVGASNPDHVITAGLPGGGGGGGGCGGGAGKGGRQGGASLALVVVDSTLMLHAAQNAIVPGPAGRGGDGGDAVPGGPGGGGGGRQTEGKRLFSVYMCGGSGGAGGAGGHGGAGSAGAGGNGGPSIGLAFSGTTPAPSSADGIYAPMPGARGRGGAGGEALGGACGGPGGDSGLPGAGALAFQLDPALNPLSSVLMAGQVLAPSTGPLISPDGKVMLVMQDDGNLCLYVSNAFRWCSLQSLGLGSVQNVLMQIDGNLCLRRPDSADRCLPGTAPAWSYLQVRNDGHVVITDGAKVYWQAPP